MDKEQFKERVREIPLFGGLVDCDLSDHWEAMRQMVVLLVLSTAPFWLATVAHGNNGFIKYNAKIFSWDDQKRLSFVAAELRRRGCRVLISNADHPSLRALYQEFDSQTIKRYSVIAASSNFRRPVTERVFF